MVTGWYIVPCMRFYYLTLGFSFCCPEHTVTIMEIVSISISVAMSTYWREVLGVSRWQELQELGPV